MYGERNINKKKVLCAWIIVVIFIISTTVTPNTSFAVGINVPVAESGAIATKEVGITVFGVSTGISLDAIAWALAKGVIAKLTKSMVSWIQGGRNGGPMFATDPEQFFQQDADNVAQDFINSATQSTAANAPYQAQVNAAVSQNYSNSRLTSGDRTPYVGGNPLSGTAADQQAYYNGDFSKGGWDQWFAMTQEGGNPYDAGVNEQNQLNTQIQLSQQTQQMQLNWGSGFTSWADCIKQNSNGVCSQYGPTRTPGSVIEGEVKNRLGSGIASLEAADGLNEVLSDVLGDVLNGVFGAGSGLFTSNTTNVGIFNGTPPVQISTPTIDFTKLAIVIAGPNPDIINLGDTYREYGAQAIDPDEGDITNEMTTTGTVNTNAIGTYIITYSVTDKKGTTATATRTVNVVATSATGGTCSPNPVTAPLNSNVTWTLIPTGGSGVYKEYLWNGDDTKTGNTGAISTIPGPVPGPGGKPIPIPIGSNNNVNEFPQTTTVPSVTVNYGTPGSLSANVTIIDASSTIAATNITCSPNVFIYNP